MICNAIILVGLVSATSQALIMGANAIFNLKLLPIYSFCTGSEHVPSIKWINALIFGTPFLGTLIGTFYYDIRSLNLGKLTAKLNPWLILS